LLGSKKKSVPRDDFALVAFHRFVYGDGLGGFAKGGCSVLGSSGSLPVFIFLAEVCVVTISTMRTIFVARGMKFLAPALGVFEVSIWLFAIGEVMKNLSDWTCSAAFAGGFTLGNFLGILLEEKLAMGSVGVRTITHRDAGALIDELRAAGYGVTRIDALGATGPVQIVYTVIKRKELDKVLAVARRFDPQVFYSVDDLHAAALGVAPLSRRRFAGIVPSLFKLQRAA
jgi:uncharacterized protein YebE (UPF0316 family)